MSVYALTCPKCDSSEVYYENPRTGCGCYACQDCGFEGKEADFNYSLQPCSSIGLIAAERQRQINEKGWTATHDAQHRLGRLARAAVCYAMPSSFRQTFINTYKGVTKKLPIGWPFGAEDWKPTPDDRIRELVKAGALIVAEIDRLQAKGGSEK